MKAQQVAFAGYIRQEMAVAFRKVLDKSGQGAGGIVGAFAGKELRPVPVGSDGRPHGLGKGPRLRVGDLNGDIPGGDVRCERQIDCREGREKNS